MAHLLLETFLSRIPQEIQRALSNTCLHINKKAYVSFNFNYLFENDSLHRVTPSYTVNMLVSCKWCLTESLLLETINTN